MAKQLTLIAKVSDILDGDAAETSGYSVRPTCPGDEEALARLYLAAYPEEIAKDLLEVRQELRITFEGEYGPLDLDSSPLALDGEKVVAGVLTVREAPWPDTPPGPFIIDIMVHPDHRRKGLALYLMKETARRLGAAGKQTVGLRVLSDNAGALRLYRSLGFREWSGDRP